MAEGKPSENSDPEQAPSARDGEDQAEIRDTEIFPESQLGEASQSKKRNRKPKSKKAKKAGTGFEEYYVDAPITPAEHEHERGLYHTSLSFAQRIETAIQRYVGKRNMDSERKNIFDKYLRFGGIDSGPKMFSGGLDAQTLAEKDAEDIRLLTATNFVTFDAADPRKDAYTVDFQACLKSFFSYTVPICFDIGADVELKRPDLISRSVGVVRNFLNYIVYHDVCPEYGNQVQASRSLCEQAERELWDVEQVKARLPGNFNRACSQIFGGIFNEGDHEMDIGAAKHVFKTGMLAHGTPDVIHRYQAQVLDGTCRLLETHEVSLEIIKIVLPSAETGRLYANEGSEDAQPLGKVITKTWRNPYLPREDLTEQEATAAGQIGPIPKTYEFWLEEEVLRKCFVGMKMDVAVRELSFGISYFDAVMAVYCSFYYVSPNALADDWREVEEEWLPRRETGGGPLKDGDEVEDGLGDDEGAGG